jgi:hypothetical protein
MEQEGLNTPNRSDSEAQGQPPPFPLKMERGHKA